MVCVFCDAVRVEVHGFKWLRSSLWVTVCVGHQGHQAGCMVPQHAVVVHTAFAVCEQLQECEVPKFIGAQSKGQSVAVQIRPCFEGRGGGLIPTPSVQFPAVSAFSVTPSDVAIASDNSVNWSKSAQTTAARRSNEMSGRSTPA